MPEQRAGVGRAHGQGAAAGTEQSSGRKYPEQCQRLSLRCKMTACRFLMSNSTPGTKASCFCVYPWVTFISFNGCAFHASHRASAGRSQMCCEGWSEEADPGHLCRSGTEPKASRAAASKISQLAEELRGGRG